VVGVVVVGVVVVGVVVVGVVVVGVVVVGVVAEPPSPAAAEVDGPPPPQPDNTRHMTEIRLRSLREVTA
jgi:hypothetical protein